VDVECIAQELRAFDLGRRLKVMYRKEARYFLSIQGKYCCQCGSGNCSFALLAASAGIMARVVGSVIAGIMIFVLGGSGTDADLITGLITAIAAWRQHDRFRN